MARSYTKRPSKYSDDIGKKFGTKTITGLVEVKPGRYLYTYRCECGNEGRSAPLETAAHPRCRKCQIIPSRRNHPDNCYASRQKVVDAFKALDRPVDEKIYHKIRDFYSSARERRISIALTEHQVLAFALQACTYCGSQDGLNGIDRLDPARGYEADNCAPCCSTCNIAKSDYTPDAFKAWATRLARHLKLVV